MTDVVALEVITDDWRDDTLRLMALAALKPNVALHGLLAGDGLLEQASRFANEEFDPFEASERLRAAGHVIAAVAAAFREHSLSPAYIRPSRKRINAAVKAFEQDAGSPAWQEI